jgi:hypothetical protein
MRFSLTSFLGLLFLFNTAHAQSQSWPAEAQLKPTAVGRECLDYPMMYEVSVDGDTVAINTPQQKTHRGPIAADGSVDVNWQLSPGIRPQVQGNARTRDLTLRLATGCLYTLKPVTAPLAPTDWKVRILQTGGDARQCDAGGKRGTVRIRGERFSLFDDVDDPYLQVKLDAKGAADEEAKALVGQDRRVRIKIGAGTAPRPFEIVTTKWSCVYKATPA